MRCRACAKNERARSYRPAEVVVVDGFSHTGICNRDFLSRDRKENAPLGAGLSRGFQTTEAVWSASCASVAQRAAVSHAVWRFDRICSLPLRLTHSRKTNMRSARNLRVGVRSLFLAKEKNAEPAPPHRAAHLPDCQACLQTGALSAHPVGSPWMWTLAFGIMRIEQRHTVTPRWQHRQVPAAVNVPCGGQFSIWATHRLGTF
jgi:hypothetical protein